ncbi:MAG: nuclease-related domain-containing protein [Paludibacter sp.]|nr:nuclease-related domain-containing protein [Paludibacter sp.]
MNWITFGVVLLVGLIVTYRKIQDNKSLETVTKLYRGTKSERALVLKLLKSGIPKQTIFHDLYLRKYNGNFSQIDLVVATKVGIIVFEVKDYNGWIFGNGLNTEWTKVMAYGKRKYRFYNPIKQNNKHIEDLRKGLKLSENIPFYSIIVFYGDCVLKDISYVPSGTYIVKFKRVLETIKSIMSLNEPAPYSDKYEIIRVMKEAVQNGENEEIQIQHIENIKGMLDKY